MASRLRRLLTLGLVTIVPILAAMPVKANAGAPLSFAPFVAVAGTPALIDAGLPDAPDFDNDGFPDSFGGQQNTELSFGGPSPSTELVPTAPALPVVVATGDFNGDGHVDLIVSALPLSFAGNSFALVLGQGAVPGGTPRAAFGAPAPLSPNVTNRLQLRVYDVNLDGADDLLAWDSSFGQVVVTFGSTTDVPLAAAPGRFGTGGTFLDVRSADFDKDGYGDMVVVDTPGPVGLASIYQGGPTGFTFIATLQLTSYAMVLGDVNGDGLVDIGTGAGRWALQVVLPPADVPEFGLPVLLPISAAGLIALAHLAQRRRLGLVHGLR